MINFNNIPVEPTVTILNSDGTELITTNNVTTFTYIRLEIKKNNLKGYKVCTKDGSIYDIHPNGKIYDENYNWTNGMTGDVHDKFLMELL